MSETTKTDRTHTQNRVFPAFSCNPEMFGRLLVRGNLRLLQLSAESVMFFLRMLSSPPRWLGRSERRWVFGLHHSRKVQVMRTRTLMPVALACALLVSAVATARASVVGFGNLGSSGVGPLDDTNTDFGPGASTNKILTQGFTTGSDSDFLRVMSATLGLFVENPGASRTVSIYTNVGGNPGAVVATSGPTFVSAKNLYEFSFGGGVTLDPLQSYWIVPQFDADSSWHFVPGFVSPTGQNASGYTWLGSRTSDNNLSGTWSNASPSLAVSLTVAPVPEPSSIALAGMGIVVVGLSFRRRMRRTTSTEANETT